MTMQRFVKIKSDITGFHKWAEAPRDVKFLADRHRHLFTIEVVLLTSSDNRAVEFFQAKRKLNSIITNTFEHNEFNEIEFGSLSCEDIAEAVCKGLGKSGLQIKSVTVYEDMESAGGVLL